MCQRSLVFQNSMNMLTHPVCPAANPHFFHPGKSRLGAVLARSLAKKDLVTFFQELPTCLSLLAGKITNSQVPLCSFQSQSTDRTKPSKKKGNQTIQNTETRNLFFRHDEGFFVQTVHYLHVSICNLLDLSQEKGSGSGIPIKTENWSDPLAGEAALLVVSDEPFSRRAINPRIRLTQQPQKLGFPECGWVRMSWAK